MTEQANWQAIGWVKPAIAYLVAARAVDLTEPERCSNARRGPWRPWT